MLPGAASDAARTASGRIAQEPASGGPDVSARRDHFYGLRKQGRDRADLSERFDTAHYSRRRMGQNREGIDAARDRAEFIFARHLSRRADFERRNRAARADLQLQTFSSRDARAERAAGYLCEHL